MSVAKKIAVILIAVPVLVVGGIYIRNKSIGPEGWAMDNTIDRLAQQLKDPESIVIRSSQTMTTVDPKTQSKTIYICGMFDGKNSFGAYGGATRFVSRSVSTESTFDTYDVTIEDPDDVALARRVNMDSSFEKVYWKPNCPTKG